MELSDWKSSCAATAATAGWLGLASDGVGRCSTAEALGRL